MRTVENSTSNFTKRDAINVRNGSALKDHGGEVIEIVKVCTGTDVDEETGDVKRFGAFITTSGDCLTFISENAIETALDLIGIINEEESVVSCRVDIRKSNGGREFIALILL